MDTEPVALLHSAGQALRRIVEQAELWRLSDRELMAAVDESYALVAQAQASALTMLVSWTPAGWPPRWGRRRPSSG